MDNANKRCKMNGFWFWHGSELANLLRKFSVTWCGATAGDCRSPESELRKSSLGQLGQTTQLLLPSVAQQNSKVKCLMVCHTAQAALG